MLFLALVTILALISLPTPSVSQGDNAPFPLALPPRVPTNKLSALPMRCKKWYKTRLPRTFET